jgi:hypothetical protein
MCGTKLGVALFGLLAGTYAGGVDVAGIPCCRSPATYQLRVGGNLGASSSGEGKAARCTWAQNLLLRPSSELCMPEILMQSAKEAQLEVAAFDHTRLALLSILLLLLR